MPLLKNYSTSTDLFTSPNIDW